jgi:uncharacterized protein YbjT (DUF2867 family)
LRVLLTGADGFIGSQVLAALIAAGHEVVACTRSGSLAGSAAMRSIACDFARDVDPATWVPRLEGVEAVVNCAGILRERHADWFEQVHVETPLALFNACAMAGVRRVVQVSALGRPEDGEFIASKHRGDARLAELDLEWVILRPSVVYSPDGSYGGTSLLRAIAALPGVIFVPGNGQQQLAPVSARDLADLIVRLLPTAADSRRTFEVAGPESMSLEAYLKTWRQWLGFGEPWVIRVPRSVVAVTSWFGELFGRGPLGMTMFRMLMSGSTVQAGADASNLNSVGWRPRSLRDSLNERPSFVQDRWHARLYLVAPLLRIALAFVWLASAVVGFITPQVEIREILGDAGVVTGAVELDYFASSVDGLLGVLLLVGWRLQLVGVLMLISLIAYTVFVGVEVPGLWLEPFGGLLKNLALMPAVLLMMATADRS